ncbi:MAG: putative toxin-antitoxin system toxin component, PIN family, partial [Actinomycetota bacterium]
MRVVLDTNVLLSAVLFRGLPRSLLESALRGGIDLVTSPTLLMELEELLHRKFHFPSELAHATRTEMESLADVVTPTEVPRVARDPEDDEVLAAAVVGAAEAIRRSRPAFARHLPGDADPHAGPVRRAHRESRLATPTGADEDPRIGPGGDHDMAGKVDGQAEAAQVAAAAREAIAKRIA